MQKAVNDFETKYMRRSLSNSPTNRRSSQNQSTPIVSEQSAPWEQIRFLREQYGACPETEGLVTRWDEFEGRESDNLG